MGISLRVSVKSKLFPAPIGARLAMPRSLLIRSDIHPYHITSRCNNKEFFPLPLREVWPIMLNRLRQTHEAHNLAIHAFVLMGNHFHLLCHTPKSNIDEAMHFFLRMTSVDINIRARTKNHLWGGRYKNDMPIWTSNTYGKAITEVVLRPNGNLEAIDGSNNSQWSSQSMRSPRNDRAVFLQDDGNLVIYEGESAIWASGTNNVFTEAEVAQSAVLRAEEMLRRWDTKYSQNRKYALLLQEDGNVVLYKDYRGQVNGRSTGTALWATGTSGQDVDAFKMQDDGNLVAYRRGNRPTWSSQTSGKGGGRSTVLMVQNDGNVVIYKRLEPTRPGNTQLYRGADPIWATQTAGK